MNTTTALTPAAGAEWFAAWFDSKHYHRLYANRDEREAAELVERLIQRVRPTASGAIRALDLGCGAGRHSRKLAALGLDVTGLDLSAASIRDARAWETDHLRFVRGDMRRPFGTQAFDLVFSLFTSFGYFEDESDHLKVVRNIARSLKPDGALVLDYMNARFVQSHLEPQEVVERDGVEYHLSRWADARHIFKQIVIHDPASPRPLEYVERVAKFSLSDFRSMFRAFGITVEDVYGDYTLKPFDPGSSPRILMVARKRREERALLSRPIPSNAADGFRRHAQI